MAGSAGFVGRERELSRLQAALGGDTRMVLVAGETGVGNTRFAGEGTRRAAAGGVVSVRGGCLPLAEKLPLLPVAEALGELSRLGGGGLLEAALGMVPPYVRAEVAGCSPDRRRHAAPPVRGNYVVIGCILRAAMVFPAAHEGSLEAVSVQVSDG